MAEHARFDWAAARDRLARVEARRTADETPTPERIRQILRDRATTLAAPPPKHSSATPAELVVFRLAEAQYAVEAHLVEAVLSVGSRIPLPGAPAFYLGLVGYRGLVYPLVDIRPLLGSRKAAPAAAQALIVISDKTAIAIAADAIEDFRRIDRELIRRVADNRDGQGLVQGLLDDSTELLDAERLLADARLIVNEEPDAGTLMGGSKS